MWYVEKLVPGISSKTVPEQILSLEKNRDLLFEKKKNTKQQFMSLQFSHFMLPRQLSIFSNFCTNFRRSEFGVGRGVGVGGGVRVSKMLKFDVKVFKIS